MTNLQIAELLRDVAASYQLKDSDKYKFQIIAYERAADAVEHATSELKDMWDDGKLTDVPGIGPSIAEHLSDIFKTGKSKHFEELMKDIPKEAFRLMELPGIGIKTAMKMIKEGNKTELKEKLGEVAEKEKKVRRQLLPYATEIASELTAYLSKNTNIVRLDPLGSLRRQAATIGDIDLSVATNEPAGVLDYFTKYPKSQKTIEKGDISSSIVVAGGIQVDLMVQPVESYGSLLQHFTGSKHHNIALREYALKKGLSLSEKGIKELKNGKMHKFSNEKDFYNFLGMDYIEPELREDTGEIEAAREHKLPNLVELKDVKSDFHIHSNFNIETSHDLGVDSMEEIVKKGESLGYEYLAFSEHNPSRSRHTDNAIVDLLKRKREKVDELNYSLSKSGKNRIQKVYNSLEIDIMPDGNIPVPSAGMETLDFAIVSIHSSFEMQRAEMTKRVLSAFTHPKAKIFGHPNARKLNEREGVELNWPELFEFALKNHKWLEINADPARLDLPDTLVREAVKLGVKLTFGTDSHHAEGMDNMRFGLAVARRGWATRSDIINTRTLKEFESALKEGE